MHERSAQAQRPRDGYCTSCRRYIGDADACAYCDAEVPLTGAMRILRIASALIATVGLALLLVILRARA